MITEHPREISFLTVIAGRKQKDVLLKAISEAGGRAVDIIYGKGSAKVGYLRDTLGFVPEEQKILITSLFAKEKSDIMIKILVEKFDFNKPNTGIAFAVPVEKLSF